MKSPEMQAILKDKGDKALSRLGDGYGISLNIGHTRANLNVYADTYKAKIDNAKNNSILKAVK